MVFLGVFVMGGWGQKELRRVLSEWGRRAAHSPARLSGDTLRFLVAMDMAACGWRRVRSRLYEDDLEGVTDLVLTGVLTDMRDASMSAPIQLLMSAPRSITFAVRLYPLNRICASCACHTKCNNLQQGKVFEGSRRKQYVASQGQEGTYSSTQSYINSIHLAL
jgi:hypothetical protein